MIVLGALLVLLAVLVILAATRATDPATLDLGVLSVDTTALGIFLAGAVTVLVLVLGLWLVASGLRRARQKRAEVKALRRQAQESNQRSEEMAARPVAPPRRQRGEKRRVREEPVVTREPISAERPDDPASAAGPAPAGATGSGEAAGSGGPGSSAATPADRPPPEGPDEHFESAPRER